METIKQNQNDSIMFSIPVIGLVIGSLLGPGMVYSQQSLDKGIENLENKNYYGAERYFRDFIRINPERADGYFYLGKVLSVKGDFDKAAENIGKAIAMDPDNSSYFTEAGINYIRWLSGVDFMRQAIYAPKALSSLRRAVELDSGNIRARIWLAGYYANAPAIGGGSKDKALEQLAVINEMAPDHIEGLFHRGLILTGYQDYPGAIHSFSRILDLRDDYYPAYLQIGKISAESGRYLTEGELSLKKYIDNAPPEEGTARDQAWWLLGNIYERQSRTAEARSAYANAVKLDPDNSEYQRSLKNIL